MQGGVISREISPFLCGKRYKQAVNSLHKKKERKRNDESFFNT